MDATRLLKAQLLHVEEKHVAGPLPLVAANERLGLKSCEPGKPLMAKHSGDSRAVSLEGMGKQIRLAATSKLQDELLSLAVEPTAVRP